MTELAAETFDRLEAEGVAVTPFDAVRIEAAARLIAQAKSSDGAPFLSAPRVRFCGGVLFHEPTIQSELWLLEVAAPLCANGDTALMLRAFALAHADEPGFFDGEDMRSAKSVTRYAKDFMRRIAATEDELVSALDYCVNGDDDGLDDLPMPKPKKRKGATSAPRQTRRDRMYADLAEAVGVTGAAIEDMKRMTPAMLDRALRRAWELNRWEFKDGEDTRASVAWHALLEEIRGKSAAHHIENRNASKSKTASASRIPGQDGDLSQRRLNDGDDVRNPLTGGSISNG